MSQWKSSTLMFVGAAICAVLCLTAKDKASTIACAFAVGWSVAFGIATKEYESGGRE